MWDATDAMTGGVGAGMVVGLQKRVMANRDFSLLRSYISKREYVDQTSPTNSSMHAFTALGLWTSRATTQLAVDGAISCRELSPDQIHNLLLAVCE